ncbi:hypothetical protein BJ170DRAFT_636807 [Xylariales sp. AK1849]|nr:hypothetical protein BJ170DRAFT_636807 [Xylariales sp. AK1849]
MAPTTPRANRKSGIHYSPHKRTKISMMYSFGLSIKTIAYLEDVCPNTIYGIKDRYRIQKSASNKPKTGRPPKLSDRDIRHYIRARD